MGPGSVETLEIWRDGMAIVRTVYRISAVWPREEAFGLKAQTRRAAVSRPANLAEGVGRGSPAETARFARLALGSIYELHTLLRIAADLGLGPSDELAAAERQLVLLCPRVSSFIRYKRNKK